MKTLSWSTRLLELPTELRRQKTSGKAKEAGTSIGQVSPVLAAELLGHITSDAYGRVYVSTKADSTQFTRDVVQDRTTRLISRMAGSGYTLEQWVESLEEELGECLHHSPSPPSSGNRLREGAESTGVL